MWHEQLMGFAHPFIKAAARYSRLISEGIFVICQLGDVGINFLASYQLDFIESHVKNLYLLVSIIMSFLTLKLLSIDSKCRKLSLASSFTPFESIKHCYSNLVLFILLLKSHGIKSSKFLMYLFVL